MASPPEALHDIHPVMVAEYEHKLHLETGLLQQLEKFWVPGYLISLAAMEQHMVHKLVVSKVPSENACASWESENDNQEALLLHSSQELVQEQA